MFRKLVLVSVAVVSLVSLSSAAFTWYTSVPTEVLVARCLPMAASPEPKFYTNVQGAPVMYIKFSAGGWGYYLLDTPESWKVYDMVVAAKAATKTITLGYIAPMTAPNSQLAFTAVDGLPYLSPYTTTTWFSAIKH